MKNAAQAPKILRNIPGLTHIVHNRPAQARSPIIPSWRNNSSAPDVRSTRKLRVMNSITLALTFHLLERGQSRVAWSQVS